MTRIILPQGSEFPDLRLPQDGSWTLSVTLSYSGDCPMAAVINFLQDQSQIGRGIVTIASKFVNVTQTPTVYQLTLNQDQVTSIVRGRCHVSELMYSVVPFGGNCSSSSSGRCCSTTQPSFTLTLSSCAAVNGQVMTMSYSGDSHGYDAWTGQFISGGSMFQFWIGCLNGSWWLLGDGGGVCNFGAQASNFTCTPTVSGSFPGGTVSGCGPVSLCVAGDTFSGTIS